MHKNQFRLLTLKNEKIKLSLRAFLVPVSGIHLVLKLI
jgi:hypothetical protein